MFDLLEQLADRIAPHFRALRVTLMLAIALPIGLVLATEIVPGLRFRFAFTLVSVVLVLGMWVAGMLMLVRWFHSKRSPGEMRGGGEQVERLFEAVFLIVWFLAPFVFVVILFADGS